jgi:NAD+ kinase
MRIKQGPGSVETGYQPKAPLNGQTFGVQYPESTSGDSVLGVDEEEEDYGSSLTRQLAETAVGVREMSKQLGQ